MERGAGGTARRRGYEVINNIIVKLPGSFKRSDEEIGRDAVHAIRLNVSLPHDRIEVRVQDAAITLMGEVDRDIKEKPRKLRCAT